ncbi:DgyrCDS1698 [Dimorphilus gyrociliatus]|uniref:receptor protein-tyrosine kinase n=1 Tax=Dimorphilus gyrociliatus TaxID=2664684 RepID=A0A7I8V9X9_9ANNE|nr:DgyrCDS1698 [Dimorphilus gyrociliatus]
MLEERTFTQLLLLIFFEHSTNCAKASKSVLLPYLTRTRLGPVRGTRTTLDNLGQVDTFIGVRYATTRGGSLRFMPPTTYSSRFEEVENLNGFTGCPQRKLDFEKLLKKTPSRRVKELDRILLAFKNQAFIPVEDCLTLNIFRPALGKNETKRFPVLVFLHGENYEYGSADNYDASILSVKGKVMAITVNYRLGALGFASTANGDAPGNYALLDQRAALHWIQENIGDFNGDRNQVTLMAHGYGAAMAHLLLISPVLSGKNLLQRVILQSGSAFSPWAISDQPLQYINRLGAALNCTKNLVRCLKSKSFKELIDSEILHPKYLSGFGPVLNHRALFPEDLESLSGKETFLDRVPILIGFTANEGDAYFNDKQLKDGVSVTDKSRILRTFVRNIFRYQRQKIYELLVENYGLDKSDDPVKLQRSLMELITDGLYISPILRLLLYRKRKKSTYLYVVSRKSAGHGTDLPLVFGAPLHPGIDPFGNNIDNNGTPISEAVVTYWTNFAKTGDPNRPAPLDVYWERYERDQPTHLDIGNKLEMKLGYYKPSKMTLWQKEIPKYHKPNDLSQKMHLLDNFQDSSTFEKEGTKKLDVYFPPPPIMPLKPKFNSSSTETSNPKSPSEELFTPATIKKLGNLPNFLSTSTAFAQETAPKSSFAFSVTVAVGCTLLFFNIIIFGTFLYKRRRLSRDLRKRRRQLEEREKVANSSANESDALTILPEPITPSRRSQAVSNSNHVPLCRYPPPFGFPTLSRTTAIPRYEDGVEDTYCTTKSATAV